MDNHNKLSERIETLKTEKENSNLQMKIKILNYLIEKLARNIVDNNKNEVEITNSIVDINKYIRDGFNVDWACWKIIYKEIDKDKDWFEEKFKENDIEIIYNTTPYYDYTNALFPNILNTMIVKQHTIRMTIKKEVDLEKN